MKREFLKQFLVKISGFPNWIKEIIYKKLSEDLGKNSASSYIFTNYKPILTYKGKCELDYKDTGFDSNIYSILKLANQNYSISEMVIDTYFSLAEMAGYFLFCVDSGYFEVPYNKEVLYIAGYLCGKYKTGEYLMNSGNITESQLNSALETSSHNSENKKIGQILLGMEVISEDELTSLITMKDEAKKRFILDSGELPNISQQYSAEADMYKIQINQLKEENSKLRKKLEHLLSMVRNDD